MLGDMYHWLVEFLLASFVGARTVATIGYERLRRCLLVAAFITAAAAILFIVYGLVYGSEFGGKMVGGSSVWRLELGKLYPASHMALLIAMIRFDRNISLREKRGARLTLLILLIVGVITFKRVQIFALILAMGISLSKYQVNLRRRTPLIGVALAGLAGVIGLISFDLVGSESISSLDYSSFSTADSLGTRAAQYQDLGGLIIDSPFGSGFGAEFDTHIDLGSGLVPSREHFLHSGYLFNALQLGWTTSCLILIFVVVCLKSLNRSYYDESAWISRAVHATLVMLVVSSFSLIPFHSASVGILIGMGLVEFNRNICRVGSDPSLEAYRALTSRTRTLIS